MSTIVFEFCKKWNFEAFWISSTRIVEVVKDLLKGATKTFYVKRQVGSKSFLSSLSLEEEAELLIQRTSLFVPLTWSRSSGWTKAATRPATIRCPAHRKSGSFPWTWWPSKRSWSRRAESAKNEDWLIRSSGSQKLSFLSGEKFKKPLVVSMYIEVP